MKETIKTRVVPSDIAKLLKDIGYDEKINENYTYTHPWVKKGCVNVVGVSFCVEEGLRYANNRTYTDRYSAMDVAFKYILRTIKNRHKSDILKEAIEFVEKEKTKKDGQAKND